MMVGASPVLFAAAAVVSQIASELCCVSTHHPIVSDDEMKLPSLERCSSVYLTL